MRERERETDRQTDRQTDRDRERERERERERQRERERDRERERAFTPLFNQSDIELFHLSTTCSTRTAVGFVSLSLSLSLSARVSFRCDPTTTARRVSVAVSARAQLGIREMIWP